MAQQAFVALHIYQMQGQAEQHFRLLTALTMMIVYQDWVCMWPGTLLIIAQHLVLPPEIPSAEGLAVLVVDDEPAVRSVARRTLERAGYLVDVAEDGEVALEMVREAPGRYGCVLLNLTMPRLSGEETQLELQRTVPSLPVVISSGFSEQEAILRFTGRGVAGFVEKPYLPADLVAAVGAALKTGWRDGTTAEALAVGD